MAIGTVVPSEDWGNSPEISLQAGEGLVWVGPPESYSVTLGNLRAPRAAGFIVPRVTGPHIPDPPPTVGGLDPRIFRAGDRAQVNGSSGWVELDGVTATEVVTSFLQDESGRILLLLRSDRVGSFRGRWAGVSGFMESVFPIDQAKKEVREETGISGEALGLAREGDVVYSRSGDRVFVIHPFRFQLRRPVDVRLDWEHTEFRWVRPEQLPEFPSVPDLDRVWEAVA